MKCPICGDEFEPKRADAKTCGKDACRKKLQRQKDKSVVEKEYQQNPQNPAPKKLETQNNDAPIVEVLPKEQWFNAFTPHEPFLDEYQPENGDVMCQGELLKGAYPKGTGTELLVRKYVTHCKYHKDGCKPMPEQRKSIDK